ncbi:hypothetical protein [Chelatococcus reniformis]|uniref:Uncharacterized protein n=1 Tax=Chelatococcus reniformis TaxID=1494448 RepID=A0A916XFR1_9HYPH|nr:hypothetical protein [Chelatococcus reniformis]GGC68606.1 hypothetical protein GCM10010994_29000 [Chelatococcus reniformis]
MTNSDLQEAAAVLRHLLDVLSAAVPDATTDAAADFRRATGQLSANAEARLRAGTVGGEMQSVFSLLVVAGTSYDAMARAWKTALLEEPTGRAAVALVNFFVVFALAATAGVIAGAPLATRSDADRYLAGMADAFDVVEDYAAGRQDSSSYRALTTLRATVVRDLTDRGRQLPRLVPYSIGQPLPALWLANRLYGDGSRAEELVQQNRAIHPLFMPMSGVGLSQ